jgi:hypothetical protein
LDTLKVITAGQGTRTLTRVVRMASVG